MIPMMADIPPQAPSAALAACKRASDWAYSVHNLEHRSLFSVDPIGGLSLSPRTFERLAAQDPVRLTRIINSGRLGRVEKCWLAQAIGQVGTAPSPQLLSAFYTFLNDRSALVREISVHALAEHVELTGSVLRIALEREVTPHVRQAITDALA